MASRPVRLRSRAASDIDHAIVYLRGSGGDAVAREFIDVLERAIGMVGRSPNVGSLRFSYELGIPELRVWSLKGFPYLVFYVAHDDGIDIWRILHSRRNILGTLARDD